MTWHGECNTRAMEGGRGHRENIIRETDARGGIKEEKMKQ